MVCNCSLVGKISRHYGVGHGSVPCWSLFFVLCMSDNSNHPNVIYMFGKPSTLVVTWAFIREFPDIPDLPPTLNPLDPIGGVMGGDV